MQSQTESEEVEQVDVEEPDFLAEVEPQEVDWENMTCTSCD